ncbi:hypothetical protein D3C85_1202620 [compost metagenome]
MGSFNNRTITGDIRHRTQRIQRLGARNTRHGVHRHHGNTARGELFHQLRVLCRPDETHQRRPRIQQRNFALGWRVHLQNHRRLPNFSLAHNLGASLNKCLVIEARQFTRAAFYRDGETQFK